MSGKCPCTAKMKNVRMRCAFRYLFCVFVGILMIISIHLSLISNRNINDLFRNSGINDVNRITGRSAGEANQLKLVKEWSAVTIQETKSWAPVTWADYRLNPSAKTGNRLIDEYGKNDPNQPGENGAGVVFVGEELQEASRLIQKYNLNVYASDRIPLNRMVPDARFPG